jgi:hypothetical protein
MQHTLILAIIAAPKIRSTNEREALGAFIP